jgi:hypothetical protein
VRQLLCGAILAETDRLLDCSNEAYGNSTYDREPGFVSPRLRRGETKISLHLSWKCDQAILQNMGEDDPD